MKAKGFTLIETLIVVTIMAILLSATVFIGYNYMRGLQVKQEKEFMVGWIEYTLGFVRTSNYYGGNKFTYLDVQLSTNGLDAFLSAGTGFDDATLEKTQLTFSGALPTVRLTPYERSCSYLDDTNATWFAFRLESLINDDEYCFNRDLSVCKLFLVTCP